MPASSREVGPFSRRAWLQKYLHDALQLVVKPVWDHLHIVTYEVGGNLSKLYDAQNKTFSLGLTMTIWRACLTLRRACCSNRIPHCTSILHVPSRWTTTSVLRFSSLFHISYWTNHNHVTRDMHAFLSPIGLGLPHIYQRPCLTTLNIDRFATFQS